MENNFTYSDYYQMKKEIDELRASSALDLQNRWIISKGGGKYIKHRGVDEFHIIYDKYPKLEEMWSTYSSMRHHKEKEEGIADIEYEKMAQQIKDIV